MNLLYGLLGQLPWWMYVLITLFLTHITIVSVTLYLHRSKTHGSVEFHPSVQHFFRFWLWLTTGMKTHEWVAVHRKHHDKCETVDDPHSPQQLGIIKLLTHGARLYKQALKGKEILVYVHGNLAKGLPDDWIEHNLYSKHPWLGLTLLGLVQTIIFGWPGLIIFGIQAFWIPIMAAGVINGLGHYKFLSYRNAETPDASQNLLPFGILIGGEELHNNHHAYQTSPRLALKWWEFDIGWLDIKILQSLGLAKFDPKKVAYLPKFSSDKEHLSKDDWLRLFQQHSYYIGMKFNNCLVSNQSFADDEGIGSLIEQFQYWLEFPTEATAFELYHWVMKVDQYGYLELQQFAKWFRGLHYGNEIT